MTRIVPLALLLLLLAPALADAAQSRPHKKKGRHRTAQKAAHHKTLAHRTTRTLPPDPNTPDPFFKSLIDSKAFLVVDGLDYPVPRNISRKPDASATGVRGGGHEVYTAVDASQ